MSIRMFDDIIPSSHSRRIQYMLSAFFRMSVCEMFNTLRPRKNGRHFPNYTFKCIFLNETVWISITISLKFVPKGPANNIPVLVQIMAWRRTGNKPLSEVYLVYWRIYASLGLNELTRFQYATMHMHSQLFKRFNDTSYLTCDYKKLCNF